MRKLVITYLLFVAAGLTVRYLGEKAPWKSSQES